MSDSTKVEMPLHVDVQLQDSTDQNAWVTKSVPESITEAMEAAPMGAMTEIVYAALARRLKKLLDPNSPFQALMAGVVNTAINFRALNPSYIADTRRPPPRQPNSGSGAGAYQGGVWGLNQDEREPTTLSMPVPSEPYAVGQDPGSDQNKGLLIAKLFADLQHHMPCVIFNLTANNYVPLGIGGSSTSKRFYQKGMVITELGYRKNLTVEATVVTEDDNSTSHLQAIIEACFGTLRDQVDFGAAFSGKSWQLMLPVHLTPSPITDIEAPWSQGDEKHNKLYTATIGLEDMFFECFTYVGRPVGPLITNDFSGAGFGEGTTISLPGETDLSGPMKLVLGRPQRLIVNGAPLTSDLMVSQSRRVIQIRRPFEGAGVYEVIPCRTGEATINLYQTGMTVSAQSAEVPTARTGAPLAQRKVVVTAV